MQHGGSFFWHKNDSKEQRQLNAGTNHGRDRYASHSKTSFYLWLSRRWLPWAQTYVQLWPGIKRRILWMRVQFQSQRPLGPLLRNILNCFTVVTFIAVMLIVLFIAVMLIVLFIAVMLIVLFIAVMLIVLFIAVMLIVLFITVMLIVLFITVMLIVLFKAVMLIVLFKAVMLIVLFKAVMLIVLLLLKKQKWATIRDRFWILIMKWKPLGIL